MNSKKKENLFYLGLYTLVFAAMCLIVFSSSGQQENHWYGV